MKLLSVFLVLASSFAALAANAAEYDCHAQDGSRAHLRVSKDGRQLRWSDLNTSSESRGVFSHVDTAPHAATRGYLLYALIDFHRTNDSEFMLALAPHSRRGRSSITAFEYFDNDDHPEDMVGFTCNAI